MLNLIKENKPALIFSSFHMIQNFAHYTVIPFLSLILVSKDWATDEITYFFAIFTLALFLSAPVIGKISDEIGRKKVILIGILLQIVFFLLYYFSNNHIIILAARFIDGIAFACISIVMGSAFQDLITEKRGFWTGLFLSIGTIGALAAPIIAGFIADFKGNEILLLLSSFLLLISFLFLIFIPEAKRERKKIQKKDFNPLSEIKDFLKYKELQGMAILGILSNSKGQIFAIFFPIFVVETLGLPEYFVGIFVAMPTVFHVFQFYFGKISDAVSSEFGIIVGVIIFSGSMFFLPYVSQIYMLVILLLVYGIGGSIWNVNAWSLMGRIAKEKNMEGEVIGTYTSIAKIGVFFTTLVSAFLVGLMGISRTLQFFAILLMIGVGISYFFFQPIFHHDRKETHLTKIKKHIN